MTFYNTFASCLKGLLFHVLMPAIKRSLIEKNCLFHPQYYWKYIWLQCTPHRVVMAMTFSFIIFPSKFLFPVPTLFGVCLSLFWRPGVTRWKQTTWLNVWESWLRPRSWESRTSLWDGASIGAPDHHNHPSSSELSSASPSLSSSYGAPQVFVPKTVGLIILKQESPM